MNRLNFNSAAALAIVCSLAFTPVSANAETAPAKKTVIQSQSELPTYSYKLGTPTASALLDDDTALVALAEAVRKDAESTLAKYEIADKSTLRDLYGAIRDAALIRGDAKSALDYSARMREIADKPAEKLTSGLRGDAVAAAMTVGDDPQQRKAAFQKAFAASINPLPWTVVRDDVIAWKGQSEIPNMASVMSGIIQGSIDPIVKQSGQISWDAARQLINVAIYLHRVDPYVAQATAVLTEYIDAHKQAKPDIWAARKFVLDDTHTSTPIIVAIWDEGVDTSLFPDRLFTNKAEKSDGKDNDGNGFVDDIHGIGFDEDENPVIESLVSFDARYPGRETELREFFKGSGDVADGVDSGTAKAFRARLALLKPEEVPALMEAAAFYFYYAHGTHVAGIATDSNSAARLMAVRLNSAEYKTKPPAHTSEVARRFSDHVYAIVDYMKSHDVRVVNMSWGWDLHDFESSLEANGIGKTAEGRRRIALESFKIYTDALTQAFRDAPQILFVAAGGNSNYDVGFAQSIPDAIDLPNILAVGAVDQAGDEASFTSYGERVRVYANGFQVESVVPGGSRMRMSGTSMAAPQVTNLAAKLFALNPKLTPVEVINQIIDGATKSTDGKRLLINPKASVGLLEAKR